MKTRITAGTTVDFVEDWRGWALCADNPDGWDLDVIGRDRDAVDAAIDRCRRECPVLDQCAAFTERLIDNRMPPQALVQAGVEYDNVWKQQHPPTEHRCRRGHRKTSETTEANGGCRICRRATQSRWKAEKRLDEAAARYAS